LLELVNEIIINHKMKKNNKKPTIIDVAKKAGVSRQTVSRVLSGSELVAESTRKRVQNVIDHLYYRPDPIARSLVNQRTFLIGVIITSFTGYTRDQILSGTEKEAALNNYNLFICGAEANRYGEPINVPLLNSQRYEGLFILYRGSKVDTHVIFNEIPDDIPVVTLGYSPKNREVFRIQLNNRRGAYLATRHLIDRGHRKIAILTGTRGRYDTEERLNGYYKALREAGHSVDPSLTFEGDWTAETAFSLFSDTNTIKPAFTAVFSQSDIMAVGLISALKKRGLRVPQDIAVVGFDNIDIGRYMDPPLSTIDHKLFYTGSQGIHMLIDAIEGKGREQKKILIPTELVIRDSSTYDYPFIEPINRPLTK
jgi:DNA-binding LacI/PurR family transcriptional regulator